MKTSNELTACPFCHVPLDKTGKHFCTAIREPQAEQKVAVFTCSACPYESGSKEEIVAHHKDAHPPAKSELERIIEVLVWSYDKGASHFKCPYFEISLPPREPIGIDAKQDAPAAFESRDIERNPNAVPFKNPIDDPDYYAESQDRFFNYQRK